MAANKVVAFGETLIDLTGDTVSPATLAEGVTAHNAKGDPITGTAVFGGSGDAVQEIVYFNMALNFRDFSVISSDATYEKITEALDAGKYVILRACFALYTSPINEVYVPITTWPKELAQVTANGQLQAPVNGTTVLMAISVTFWQSGEIVLVPKIINVTPVGA